METLLLIPDISGFTTFVNETEVDHSRHIVSELLELVIDADQLDLTVAEVEGDAVFFYSAAGVPSAGQVLEQARRTFVRFHEHLKLYETRRICQCGACVSAHTLSLKMVAHVGDIGFVEVRGNRKPHGPDVILVHRLLKNEIASNEYLLATDRLLADGPAGDSRVRADWADWEMGSSSYEGYGRVPYCHVSLSPLHREVVDPPPVEDYPRLDNPVTLHVSVPLPQTEAFELVSNLQFRHLWNEGVDDLVFEPGRVNRVGTNHQCIIQGKMIDFQTMRADYGEDAMVMGERTEQNPLVRSFATFWVLVPEAGGTRVTAEIHYEPKSFVLSVLFRLMIRYIMTGAIRQLERAATRFGSLERPQALQVEAASATG